MFKDDLVLIIDNEWLIISDHYYIFKYFNQLTEEMPLEWSPDTGGCHWLLPAGLNDACHFKITLARSYFSSVNDHALDIRAHAGNQTCVPWLTVPCITTGLLSAYCCHDSVLLLIIISIMIIWWNVKIILNALSGQVPYRFSYIIS